MDDEPLDTLARRVAYLQRHSGLDSAPLSKRCGLSQSHLGQIIREHIEKPAPETLIAIARTFHVSLEWLMTGEGATPDRDWIARLFSTDPLPSTGTGT